MSPNTTKLRTALALALAAALTLIAPAAAAGRAASPLTEARTWLADLLPSWLQAWIAGQGQPGEPDAGEAGHGIDPNGGTTTSDVPGGTENKAGHTIDPNG